MLAARWSVSALLVACSPQPGPPAGPSPPAAPVESAAPREPTPPTPPAPVGLAAPISALAIGPHHACALRGGQLFCWGQNERGMLGVGEPDLKEVVTPRRVPALERVVQVAVDYDFTCAVDEAHAVHCWGHNDHGQLGVGDTEPRAAPTPIAGLVADRVVAGFQRACAVQGRDVRCWGTGDLGDGKRAFRQATPLAIAGLVITDDLALGDGHACLLDAGEVRCWGQNDSGQLGTGAGGCRYERERCPHSRCLPESECQHSPTPVRAVGLPPISRVRAGGSFTYTLDRTGTIWSAGQQGVTMDFTTDAEKYRPHRVEGVPAMVEIDAGSSHACARTAGGELWCWGNNAFGQLGHPKQDRWAGSEGPSPVAGLPPVSALAVGFHSTCVVTGGGADSEAWCWGDNGRGQLGDGTTERRAAPARVRWQ